MARQEGIIKLKGQVGGLSFYKTGKDGFLAREKGGIDADRIRNDPAFERTRENGAEFGRAGSAGKLLRTALRSLTQNASDSRMSSRLTREMLRVVQADATNPRGKRNVIDGETELLQGFEFNANANLSSTFFPPFETTINRVAGTLSIHIPAFVPGNMLAVPQGATHASLVSAGVEIDFENQVYVVSTARSADIALGPEVQAAIDLNNAVTAASTQPLFLVLGIDFHQKVNGLSYPLKNGTFNALALVKVDGGAEPS